MTGVQTCALPIFHKIIKDKERLAVNKIMNDANLCDNASEEYEYLMHEKRKLEKDLSNLPKNDPKKKSVTVALSALQTKLSKNRQKNPKSKNEQKNLTQVKNDSNDVTLRQILCEIKNHELIQRKILATLESIKTLLENKK